MIFQSTRPSRASTCVFVHDFITADISIHKALTGLDKCTAGSHGSTFHFNPQGPHGPRRKAHAEQADIGGFQSTRPSRASTPPLAAIVSHFIDFNPQGPHGPRRYTRRQKALPLHFNPQGPHGPRLLWLRRGRGNLHISIHKALTGLDRNFY